jgi:DNA-binding transcriptional LysR family regulator
MNIGFSFRQLEYFVAVAECGSTSAAARAKHVSQPSISLALSQLETVLGESLFRRQGGRGLELTVVGQRTLGRARDILGLATVIAEQPTASQQLAGHMSLVCFQDLGPYFAPRLLAGFRALHPQVQVTLLETDLAQVSRTLASGKAEVALTYELGIEPLTERHVLAELEPYALLPTDHPLAAQERVSLGDLANECLILEDIVQTREYFMSLFWMHDLQPASQQFTQTFEMQRGLVAHGYGVALSCTRPAGDCSYDGRPLACRPLRETVKSQRVVLAQSGAMRPSPIVQAFMAWAAR